MKVAGNPSSLRHRAYQHIQRKIHCGELPAGHVVSENILAPEIGMSRTPVREAIQHLEHDGLLGQVPCYGTVVRTLSRRDLKDLYELRSRHTPTRRRRCGLKRAIGSSGSSSAGLRMLSRVPPVRPDTKGCGARRTVIRPKIFCVR